MTPEGKVKAKIKRLLSKYECWSYMPVSNGMGAPALDFQCSKKGRAFAIEAKAPGKKPTPRQVSTMREYRGHNIPSFVCDGTNYDELEAWIIAIDLDCCICPYLESLDE